MTPIRLPSSDRDPFTYEEVRRWDKMHGICNYLPRLNLRVSRTGFPPNDSRCSGFQPRTLSRPSSAVLSCPASALW